MSASLSSLLGVVAATAAAVVALLTKGFSVARLLMPARTVDTVDMTLTVSRADLERGPTSLRLAHPFAGIDAIAWKVEGAAVGVDLPVLLGDVPAVLRVETTPDACLVTVRRAAGAAAAKAAPKLNVLGTDARNRSVAGHLTLALATAPEPTFVVSLDGAPV